MDRVFNVINLASYPVKKIEMELYYKVSPYSKEVEKYIKEHLLWEQGYVSDSDKLLLNNWIEKQFDNNSYFLGVDLVSFLSISWSLLETLHKCSKCMLNILIIVLSLESNTSGFCPIAL